MSIAAQSVVDGLTLESLWTLGFSVPHGSAIAAERTDRNCHDTWREAQLRWVCEQLTVRF